MSEFAVRAERITIEPHPDPETTSLEVGLIRGYQVVVRKGEYKTGDMVVYIPEQAILPTWLIEEMGLTGKLAGPESNRVKAVRLRGVVSQGLVYVPHNVLLGSLNNGDVGPDFDFADTLGITKWEPPIPAQMAGEVEAAPSGFITYTDIDNIKTWPDVLQSGEEVIITEKLHGTCMIAARIRNSYLPTMAACYVSSKGLAGRHLTLKENEKNVYWRAFHQFRLDEALEKIQHFLSAEFVVLFGEVLGVQDLMYGLDKQKSEITFRAFDIYASQHGGDIVNGVKTPHYGAGYLDADIFKSLCHAYNIPLVPKLYVGPFSQEVLLEHTVGNTTLAANHIREGVVVKPTHERLDTEAGRVIVKSINPAYLLRKNGTEMN